MPLTAMAEAPLTLGDLTVEKVEALRTAVLDQRAEAERARGAAFDLRAQRDMERALTPEADAYFDTATRDKAKALREACAAEDWSACTELAALYHAGEGTWVDDGLAFAFYVTACHAGDPQACANVLWDWRIEAASGLYEGHAPYAAVIGEACDAGAAESCRHLAMALGLGVGAASKDEARAAALMEKACALGDAKACDKLPKTPAEQVANFQAQCDQGRAFGCYLLGDRLYGGNGAPQDAERGEALVRESCAAGVSHACAWLARTFSLEAQAYGALLEQGCIAHPGSICIDAMHRLGQLPDSPTLASRIDHVRRLACQAPDTTCIRTLWERIAEAGNAMDPFDPALVPPSAAAAQAACAQGALPSCQELAWLFAHDQDPARKLIGPHILTPFCDRGDGAVCLEVAALLPHRPNDKSELYTKACAAGAREGCLWQARLDQALAPAERMAPLKAACGEGDLVGCRLQAELLLAEAGQFESARQDRERAHALNFYACEAGDGEACLRHGLHLFETSQDGQDEALGFLDRACADGQAAACFRLGNVHDEGALAERVRYYGQACQLSLGARYCDAAMRAETEVARTQLRAEHGALASALMDHDRDFRGPFQARVRRARRDCRAGDMAQCVNLGDRYIDALEVDGVDGLKDTTPRDEIWARALFAHACEKGAADGCDRLAASYEEGLPYDPEAAFEAAQRGCALGSAMSCYRLGEAHMEGETVALDLIAAETQYRRACELGFGYGCERLASYEMWEGAPATRDERFVLACLHGDWFACGSLRDDLRAMGKPRVAERCAQIACDEGDDEVCHALGRPPQN